MKMTQSHDELTRYLELTPNSRVQWEAAREYTPGGDSRNSIFWQPYPIFIESAAGCHVDDADGVDRLEFLNTMTTTILGHGAKPVMDAVRQQLDLGLADNAPVEAVNRVLVRSISAD